MAFSAKTRALVACCGLACCFTGFSARLVHLQVTRHEEYKKLALGNYTTRQTITARRGTIQDVRGLPLAQNEPVKTVIADGSLIKDPLAVAQLLSPLLQMPEAVLREKLSRTRFSKEKNAEVPMQYIVLKRDVEEQVATEILDTMAKAKLRGIHFEQDFIRVYPNEKMLCHVLGFLNGAGTGMEGIERSMDEYLKGRDGFRYTERDRMGREMVAFRGEERPARDGGTVQLTVDSALQMIVEKEMDAAMVEYRPQSAVCILMRPQTGEILALSNRPHFDLNKQEEAQPEDRKNVAIMSMVEPGSTFKIVTIAAALATKQVKPTDTVYCENGRFNWGGKVLRDSHPEGVLTVSNVLVKSSNIGVAKLALGMGEQRLYEYVRKFGFGDRSGILLPGEIRGLVHPPHTWSKISITRVPMGHEVAATPLQVVSATATIANGGKLMMPQIVREVRDCDGKVLATYPPQEVRRVVSEEVAHQIVEAMKEVTGKEGTAKKAAVPGFKVGGKTGTAQRVSPTGGYEAGKYVVSFAGFMPADKPEFVCLVMLDDAKTQPGMNYGGQVAAPIFARIAEKVARHMDLQPTEPLVPTPGSETTKATESTTDEKPAIKPARAPKAVPVLRAFPVKTASVTSPISPAPANAGSEPASNRRIARQ